MKAIIETGGKQYHIEQGTVLYIEKLDVPSDGEIVFDKVLMLNGAFGRPYVTGSKVTGKVLKHGKAKKIKVFKYKPKKKSTRRTQGHRQPYTKVEITKIG